MIRPAGVAVLRWLALIVPPAIVLFVIFRYGVNAPYSDQWGAVFLLGKLQAGTIGWQDIWLPHNEHRMVFPKLLMLGLAQLTGWNILAELLTSFLLAGAGLCMLVALMRPVLDRLGPWIRIGLVLTVSAAVFSLAQWENWLWGWQIQWFLSTAGVICAVALSTWSLDHDRPWRQIVGAAAAAVVCHYSLASGVAIWFACALIFAFHRNRRWVLPIWFALAGSFIALYFATYALPGDHQPLGAGLERPGSLLRYVANYLSGPFGRGAGFGLAAIAAFVVLAVAAYRRHGDEPKLVLPWIAFGAYAGASAGVTGLGRVALGVDQALSSRYATVAALLALAIAMLAVLMSLRRDGTPRRPLAAVTIIALLVFIGAGDVRSIPHLVAFHRSLAVGRDCLVTQDEPSDACLTGLFHQPELVRDHMMQLRALGWSGFATPDDRSGRRLTLAELTGTRRWTLRAHGGRTGTLEEAKVEDGALMVQGWAVHPEGNDEVTRRVLVVADRTVIGEAEITTERTDLSWVFKDRRFNLSGWKMRVDAAAIANRSRLYAFLVLQDGLLVPLWGSRDFSALR